MNVGNILKNLIERKSSTYNLQYGNQFDGFFTTISSLPEISSIKIEPILLITDQTPYSLISIAYTIKLIEALGKETRVYAITEGMHTEIIKKISKEYKLKLQDLIELKDPTVDDIQTFVDKNKIGLVVISYAHRLKRTILDNVSVTVLISSLKNI